MPSIHPTAIIGPDGDLADDVEIGPWCSLAGRVTLGPRCRLLGNVYLQGPLAVGAGNTFYPFVCLGFDPQDLSYVRPEDGGVGIAMGCDNTLRESVTIHAATGQHPTTIGDGNLLMVNCHFGHDAILGNRCIVANGTLVAGHVEIADDVVFGGNATVHQFCRIGRLSMISGLHGVGKDVPPFCMVRDTRRVASLNLVGLRRAGLRKHIKPLGQAFDLLYRQKLPNRTAAERIEKELGDDPLCWEFARFAQTTQRGITPYAPPRDAERTPAAKE